MTMDGWKSLMEFLITYLKNPESPQNILMVGVPSAGKSSFINLMKSALIGQYEEVARPGAVLRGNRGQLTKYIRKYEAMGLTKDQMVTLRNIMNEEIQGPDVPRDFCLPTIIDMPGLENNVDLVLDLVLDGLVPYNTVLSAVSNAANGLSLWWNMPKIDVERAEERKIDFIVFVTSFNQDVPVHVISTAFEKGCQDFDRAIPYSLVITHADVVNVHQETRNERRRIMEEILHVSRDSTGITTCLSNYHQTEGSKNQANVRNVYPTNWRAHRNAFIAMRNIVRPQDNRHPFKKPNKWKIRLRIYSYIAIKLYNDIKDNSWTVSIALITSLLIFIILRVLMRLLIFVTSL